MASDVLHGDDTPVPVLAPGTDKTKTGRPWTYVRDELPHGGERPPAAAFVYSPDRKGERPRDHLKCFKGHLHGDGYAGFNALFETGRITEAACWAHVRSKFYDVHVASGSPLAKEALHRIGALYWIEELIRGRLPDERQQTRQERSMSLLAELHDRLAPTKPKLSAKSDLAGAIRYTLSR